MPKLTEALLRKYATHPGTANHPPCGWKYTALDALGIRDKHKGWISRNVGKQVSEKQISNFIRLQTGISSTQTSIKSFFTPSARGSSL